MEKEVNTTLWIEDGAIRINSDLSDFDGNVEQWKKAFYEVWRYQMSWDFAYSIKVGERRKTGVYINLLIKKAYLKPVKEMLKDLGYRNVTESAEHIGIVQTYDISDPAAEKMYEVFAD